MLCDTGDFNLPINHIATNLLSEMLSELGLNNYVNIRRRKNQNSLDLFLDDSNIMCETSMPSGDYCELFEITIRQKIKRNKTYRTGFNWHKAGKPLLVNLLRINQEFFFGIFDFVSQESSDVIANSLFEVTLIEAKILHDELMKTSKQERFVDKPRFVDIECLQAKRYRQKMGKN